MEETKKEPIGLPMMSGINLPRIEIPTFDGNILNWRLYWEQFQGAVHDKAHFEEVDKLMYLRHALKDGPARNVIQGLTQSAESYQDSVRYLKDRYDWPRLVHREHVRSIVQVPPMKPDNGRCCKGFMTSGTSTSGQLRLSTRTTSIRSKRQSWNRSKEKLPN